MARLSITRQISGDGRTIVTRDGERIGTLRVTLGGSYHSKGRSYSFNGDDGQHVTATRHQQLMDLLTKRYLQTSD